jgi:hypothetical protein
VKRVPYQVAPILVSLLLFVGSARANADAVLRGFSYSLTQLAEQASKIPKEKPVPKVPCGICKKELGVDFQAIKQPVKVGTIEGAGEIVVLGCTADKPHAFCINCLENFMKDPKNAKDGKFGCPVCKKEWTVDAVKKATELVGACTLCMEDFSKDDLKKLKKLIKQREQRGETPGIEGDVQRVGSLLVLWCNENVPHIFHPNDSVCDSGGLKAHITAKIDAQKKEKEDFVKSGKGADVPANELGKFPCPECRHFWDPDTVMEKINE